MVYIDKVDYTEIEDRTLVTLKKYISLQESKGIKPDDMLLCAAIPIEQGSDFARKPIAESGFVERYEGIIVGVERNLLPIASPSRDFILLENDILWVLGAQNMLDTLIKNGLLEE